jgi:regulator of nucleoside diphosphate kinase
MTKARKAPSRPRVVLTATDHHSLMTLANKVEATAPQIASSLLDELDRAHVLGRGRMPIDVVQMGSVVEFRDETTGQVRTVTLVYPGEADIAEGKVSVLTPIGTALIGLGVGASIDWDTRTGGTKRLTVLAVHEPALA